MQNGKPLDWVQNNTLQMQSLNWYANYTQNITSTVIISLVLATQEQ